MDLPYSTVVSNAHRGKNIEINSLELSGFTPQQRLSNADELLKRAIELNEASKDIRKTADELDVKADLFESLATAFHTSAQDDRAKILSNLEDLLIFYGDLPDKFQKKPKYILRLSRVYLAAEEGRATPQRLEKTRWWLAKHRKKAKANEKKFKDKNGKQVSSIASRGDQAVRNPHNVSQVGKLNVSDRKHLSLGSEKAPYLLRHSQDSQEPVTKRERSESIEAEDDAAVNKRTRPEEYSIFPMISNGPSPGQHGSKDHSDIYSQPSLQCVDIGVHSGVVSDPESKTPLLRYDDGFWADSIKFSESGLNSENCDKDTRTGDAGATFRLMDMSDQNEDRPSAPIEIKKENAAEPCGPLQNGFSTSERVIITNLPSDLSEEEIMELFHAYEPSSIHLLFIVLVEIRTGS